MRSTSNAYPQKSISGSLSSSELNLTHIDSNVNVIRDTGAASQVKIRRTVSDPSIAGISPEIKLIKKDGLCKVSSKTIEDFQISSEIKFINDSLRIMPGKTIGDLQKRHRFLKEYLDNRNKFSQQHGSLVIHRYVSDKLGKISCEMRHKLWRKMWDAFIPEKMPGNHKKVKITKELHQESPSTGARTTDNRTRPSLLYEATTSPDAVRKGELVQLGNTSQSSFHPTDNIIFNPNFRGAFTEPTLGDITKMSPDGAISYLETYLEETFIHPKSGKAYPGLAQTFVDRMISGLELDRNRHKSTVHFLREKKSEIEALQQKKICVE